MTVEPSSLATNQPRLRRRSPLAPDRDRLPPALAEIPFLTQIGVRFDPAVEDGLAAVETALGVVLPIVPNTVTSRGDRFALWLGPDEWLVVGPDGDEIAQPLAAALTGVMASVLDMSANRTTIEIRGPRAREVLEAGCSIDLHRRAFGPGQCAQTWLARANVILHQLDDEPRYRILVRPSFVPYLATWLLDTVTDARRQP